MQKFKKFFMETIISESLYMQLKHPFSDFECLLSPKGNVLPYTTSGMNKTQQLGVQR